MIDSFSGQYEFLSNFYSAPIQYRGRFYSTNEHFYQAFKAAGLASHEEIRNAPTPHLAKKRGRAAKLVPTWEEDKYGVMWLALYLKFTQHQSLAVKLIATHNNQLVEGNNWHDQIWGSCECTQHANTPGQNWLGIMLMQVRNNLVSGFPLAPITQGNT